MLLQTQPNANIPLMLQQLQQLQQLQFQQQYQMQQPQVQVPQTFPDLQDMQQSQNAMWQQTGFVSPTPTYSIPQSQSGLQYVLPNQPIAYPQQTTYPSTYATPSFPQQQSYSTPTYLNPISTSQIVSPTPPLVTQPGLASLAGPTTAPSLTAIAPTTSAQVSTTPAFLPTTAGQNVVSKPSAVKPSKPSTAELLSAEALKR